MNRPTMSEHGFIHMDGDHSLVLVGELYRYIRSRKNI